MSTWNFLFKYLSTISFRIKLASLLSTFLKFFISLLGGLTAEVFPFWSFPACGDTWSRNNPKDDNFIWTWNYVITREPKVFTLESVNLEAGRTVVRARFVAAPLAAGWLFGTAFACGRTWLEVCWGRLLFLDSNVDSEKQTPGIKQNNRLQKTCESIKQNTNLRERAYPLPCWDWWPFYLEVSSLVHTDLL